MKKDHAAELKELYKNKILKASEERVGRPLYQYLARYIRRVKKLDGTEEAEEIIDHLKKKYPARYALHEELNLI